MGTNLVEIRMAELGASIKNLNQHKKTTNKAA
ncbi:hypothetical protein [uncultured Gammaproteobacteria bacterium]|jgi:hypothetical protein|nr:hypothetical protein BROOK1789B_1783 [Bathymodiolus brooksi thiotrophic gill symbiont]CAC9534925.1 hypothetical protein [uncultured Gammaproteobacteria bacterium]CAB9543432.1 hypothetical protein BROOK1789C_942 [Bathymodiolus brooksi thiotrophic gill symbiont]CAC9538895.1 hypothetical protein [uncultured Gammaproteobacteria bacterium]CAC9550183.1 hypothetical protein [uncultured Gammaproteobacteria bacterium]